MSPEAPAPKGPVEKGAGKKANKGGGEGRNTLSRLLGVLLLVISFGGGWLLWGYDVFKETPLDLAGERTLVVAPGTTLNALAARLAAEGSLTTPRYLLWHARFTGQAGRIKAGEYLLTPGLTGPQLLTLLVEGRTVQHRLTLVEGWNFRDVRRALAAESAIVPTLAGVDDEQLMVRLGHPGQHPEGRFFPDTYHFPRGTTDLEFLRRAYDAMSRVLAEEWQRRAPDLPLESPDQALILASIIEKETGLASERAAIAGVFVRRLRKGMLLQTDPTVIYGRGAEFDGNLTRAHLREDTPYNTYTRKGLPPTPIAMPGRAALHAALHPAPGEALYFVARGDGSHHFSATLKEHHQAVVRYQIKRNRKGGG